MTLIYHVYPADQWCDPKEGTQPFVSKADFDDEVNLWKSNHKFASNLADDLTQDGIKERARIAALKARVRELEAPWTITKKLAIEPTAAAADAFWKYWRENGETHKHGYYESTWGAINAALNVTAPETGGVKSNWCSICGIEYDKECFCKPCPKCGEKECMCEHVPTATSQL